MQAQQVSLEGHGKGYNNHDSDNPSKPVCCGNGTTGILIIEHSNGVLPVEPMMIEASLSIQEHGIPQRPPKGDCHPKKYNCMRHHKTRQVVIGLPLPVLLHTLNTYRTAIPCFGQ